MALLRTNTGIGTTNPTSALHVIGDVLVTGVVTSTTFNGNINAGVGTIVNLTSTRLTSGVGTITDLTNTRLTSGIATITSLTNTRMTSGVSTITTLDNITATILDLDNLRMLSGIATITELDATTIVSVNTDLQHLNANFGNIDVGIITDLSGTRLNYTGVGTITTLNSTTATITDLTNTRLTSGIATIATLDNTYFTSGVSTITTLNNTTASITDLTNTRLTSGIATITDLTVTNSAFTNLNINNLNAVTGVITDLSGTRLNYTGVGTVTTLNSTNATLTNINSSGISTLGDTSTTNLSAQQLNVSGASTISVNSSSDALRITQSGSGNALVVEDSSNPDTSPFVIRGGGFGWVGIGTTIPRTELHLQSTDPTLMFWESDASANNQRWINTVEGEYFYWQALSDSGSGGGNIFRMSRSGSEIQTFEGRRAGTTWFVINNDTRRVGIGTTNPVESFQVNSGTSSVVINSNGNIGVGTTTPSSRLTISGNGLFTGVVTATTFIGNLTGTATTATKLETPRTFEITGDIVASPITFDGTGNVALAATIQPNSVGLGTDTFGDYVKDISGTVGEIVVTGGTGEGSTPVISFDLNPTIGGNVTIGNDLQVNNNLNVTGNITVGGTTGYILVENFRISDADIILGFTTDSQGNDVSNDITANHGGIAIASTEGYPLVNLNIVGVETLPPTYKKIMWFQAGAFAGLNTDAWLSNYAIGIGSTQFPTGTRLAAGSVQFTENDLAVVRNINASGIITAASFSGNSSSANYATTAGFSTFSGYANTSGFSTFSGYANNAGIATYAVTAGVSTYSGVSGFSTFSGYSNASGVSTFSGYSNTSGFSTFSGYSNASGVSTFSGYSNASGFSTFSGYSNTSGFSTFSGYSNTSGFSTFSGYSNVSGIATYAVTAGVSTYAGVSGFSTFSGYSNTSGFSTFSGYSNTSGFSTFSGYSNTSGFSTFSGYANNSGIATYAVTAGVSTYAGIAGVSTSVIGGIASVTQLQVTGISTFSNGPIFVGSATSTGTASQRLQVTGGAYVSGNTGIGTTNPTSALHVVGNVNLVGAASTLTLQPLQINQTWTTGTGIATAITLNVTDTSSSSSSRLVDLRIDGTSRFRVEKSGVVRATELYLSSSANTDSIFQQRLYAEGNTGLNFSTYNNYVGGFYSTDQPLGIQLRNTSALYWSNASTPQNNGPNCDLFLLRDSGNVLALRNTQTSGIGQTFRIYNTYTSATNFERANVGWTTNTFIVGTEKGSAGGTARQLELQTDGTTRVAITTTGFVGIATTNPTSRLTVQGDSLITGVSTLGTVQISSGIVTASTVSGIVTYYGDGSKLTGISAGAFNIINQPLTSTTVYPTFASNIGVASVGITSTQVAYIPSSNRLGIGTTNPNYTLEIVGNTRVSGLTSVTNLEIYGTVGAGNTVGNDGQYLKSTGVGVTWASFPTLRTTGITTATQGQTVFNFAYNVGFLDVYVNGVKLTNSEFTAVNGANVTLQSQAFSGDIVEFVSYNTVSTGSGSGGAGSISLDSLTDVVITNPQEGESLGFDGTYWINDYTFTTTTATSSQVPIHTLSSNDYRSVEYMIQVTNGTNYHLTKILVLHNGTTAYNTEYGTISTGPALATFDTDVLGGAIRLLATPYSSSTMTYKIKFTAIKA